MEDGEGRMEEDTGKQGISNDASFSIMTYLRACGVAASKMQGCALIIGSVVFA
jgi:hypothetical protein